MARKKNTTTEEIKKVNEVAEEVKVSADIPDETAGKPTIQQQMSEHMEKLKALCAKYNESAEYAEFAEMSKLEKKMDEEIDDYNELAEQACFGALRRLPDPMMGAVMQMTYEVVGVKDVREKDKPTLKEVRSSTRFIDLLRLHRYVRDGIGAVKTWYAKIERLNFEMANRTALELEAELVKLEEYKMADSARDVDDITETKAEGFSSDAANAALAKDIQTIVNAMLGEGYTVTNRMVMYVLHAYCKFDNRNKLSVVSPNHKTMRQIFLNVCHAAVTGNQFSVAVKKVR